MNKKCLLIIQNLTPTGSPNTFLHLCKTLKEIGFDVDVFVFAVCDEKYDLFLLPKYKEVTHQIIFDHQSMSSIRYRAFPNLCFQNIKKHLKREHYDLVISNNYHVSSFLIKKRKKYNDLKIGLYSLGEVNIKSKHLFVRLRESFTIKRLEKLDLFYALSTNTIFKNMKLKEGKIYNLLDYPENYYPANKPFRHKNKIVLGQIGYFCENKNQLFSLEVLKQIRNEGIDAELKFIGYSASYHNYLNKMLSFIKKNKLENHIQFLDKDYAKIKFFSEISILLFPSESEGLGLVLFEAQCSNVPCIASKNVPPETNLGLCTYLPLDIGYWKEYIKDIKYCNHNTQRLGINLRENFYQIVKASINDLFGEMKNEKF